MAHVMKNTESVSLTRYFRTPGCDLIVRQWRAVRFWRLTLGVCLIAGVLFHPAVDRAADELAKPASWSVLTGDQVRSAVEQWLSSRGTDATAQEEFNKLWPVEKPVPDGIEPLDHVATTIAALEEPARELVSLCRTPRVSAPPPRFEWLTAEQTPPFVRNNLRLVYGRWLAQHGYYDEALELLKDLKPADVIDAATLLFYRAAAHHRLLEKDQCLAQAAMLLENESAIPRRYASVAQLMVSDIRPLEVDSLDEVSRLMDDIRRRLQFGRAGRHVRQREDDVIAKLDKMIEEAEKQQQQQQMAAAGQQSLQPGDPAQDSLPMQGRGPGDVDQKQPGKGAEWGNLPPKEREEALQQLSKDLPAHYRELIEEYFRKLARDGGQ